MEGDAATAATVPGGVDQLDYESALAELDQVLARLEDGQVSLEESMTLYERGVSLVRRCSSLLDGAERRVTELSVNSAGMTQETPLLFPGEDQEVGRPEA